MHRPVKTILQDIEGCVKPGEMLLVLGRPGSGCTSLLKALASYRDGYRSVDGTILYEGLDHRSIDGPLRGDVVYSPEDDVHFPTLTVGQTLRFATATRAPNTKYRITLGETGDRQEYIDGTREVLATVPYPVTRRSRNAIPMDRCSVPRSAISRYTSRNRYDKSNLCFSSKGSYVASAPALLDVTSASVANLESDALT